MPRLEVNPADVSPVDQLIETVVKKLQANRHVLQKSPDYGRLIWRRKKGELEIDLELKI